MKRERLQQLFSHYENLKIAVAGDLFLDYWWSVDTALNEPSIETGITAYQVVGTRHYAGAAGTVLNNLSEMGVGHLEAISMVGNDGFGWEILQCLRERGVSTENVIISDRVVTPAYVKPLFPEEGNRFDIKNFSETPRDIQAELIRRMEDALERCDALILLDQVCEPDVGVLTAEVREAACKMALRHPDKLVFADSRAFIHLFHDVVIKCNNLEAARMTGRSEEPFSPENVFACMDELSAKTNRPAVMTCNVHGVAVESEGCKQLIPAVKHHCEIDVVGAGDACTSGLVTALCAGATYAEAAFIGNLSSGVTVRQLKRTGTASREAMLAMYDEQWPEGMDK